MPLKGEFAKFEPIRRLTQKATVVDMLRRSHRRKPETARIKPMLIERTTWLPKMIVAIDGSHQEVPIENGFPGAEVSYLTIASVLLDVARMRELDAHRPVDPSAFADLQNSDAIDAVLPGVNIVVEGQTDARASMRSELFTLFDGNSSFGVETLLETYEALKTYAKSDVTFECPSYSCSEETKRAPRGTGAYLCPCETQFTLYSTDALRFSTGMNEASGQNGAMYAEISQVIEHLWLLNILRSIERNGWITSFKRMAFVMDGPLAIFGHPAWLSQAIIYELGRLNAEARRVNGEDLLILGVEKSGLFMSHFERIAVDPERKDEDYFPKRSTLLLDDQYIKRNVIFSSQSDQKKGKRNTESEENVKLYGKDTYYGRKFLYKTTTGALIVGVSPFFRPADRDLKIAQPSQYPRLGDALNILDALVSARYPNAIIPLIAAHAEAAIPLNMGSRVLEIMTRQLID